MEEMIFLQKPNLQYNRPTTGNNVRLMKWISHDKDGEGKKYQKKHESYEIIKQVLTTVRDTLKEEEGTLGTLESALLKRLILINKPSLFGEQESLRYVICIYRMREKLCWIYSTHHKYFLWNITQNKLIDTTKYRINIFCSPYYDDEEQLIWFFECKSNGLHNGHGVVENLDVLNEPTYLTNYNIITGQIDRVVSKCTQTIALFPQAIQMKIIRIIRHKIAIIETIMNHNQDLWVIKFTFKAAKVVAQYRISLFGMKINNYQSLLYSLRFDDDDKNKILVATMLIKKYNPYDNDKIVLTIDTISVTGDPKIVKKLTTDIEEDFSLIFERNTDKYFFVDGTYVYKGTHFFFCTELFVVKLAWCEKDFYGNRSVIFRTVEEGSYKYHATLFKVIPLKGRFCEYVVLLYISQELKNVGALIKVLIFSMATKSLVPHVGIVLNEHGLMLSNITSGDLGENYIHFFNRTTGMLSHTLEVADSHSRRLRILLQKDIQTTRGYFHRWIYSLQKPLNIHQNERNETIQLIKGKIVLHRDEVDIICSDEIDAIKNKKFASINYYLISGIKYIEHIADVQELEHNHRQQQQKEKLQLPPPPKRQNLDEIRFKYKNIDDMKRKVEDSEDRNLMSKFSLISAAAAEVNNQLDITKEEERLSTRTLPSQQIVNDVKIIDDEQEEEEEEEIVIPTKRQQENDRLKLAIEEEEKQRLRKIESTTNILKTFKGEEGFWFPKEHFDNIILLNRWISGNLLSVTDVELSITFDSQNKWTIKHSVIPDFVLNAKNDNEKLLARSWSLYNTCHYLALEDLERFFWIIYLTVNESI